LKLVIQLLDENRSKIATENETQAELSGSVGSLSALFVAPQKIIDIAEIRSDLCDQCLHSGIELMTDCNDVGSRCFGERRLTDEPLW
jgi:hypothetical protein